MTYESLVNELHELRRARDRSDARLLIRLCKAEEESLQLIIETAGSFAQLVQIFVKPTRYEAFKRGVERIGYERAEEIGSESTIKVGMTSNAAGAERLVEAAKAWIADHGDMMPTEQTAKHLLMQVDPRREQPQALRRRDELAELRAENVKLRAENAALRATIKRLEKATARGKRATEDRAST